ncbi:F0F1 ATP synthase subunit alpha, partial [Arthrospira platensis SPKY1]|nr:F0F1 ATP synthase subunit alpha [Arthrospira platensis SPKY1]
QTKVVKKLSGGIRTDLAQYRELAAFAQFASDLDDATRKQLERGRRVTELMKQQQYSPMSIAEMAVILFAVNNGYFDDIQVERVLKFEHELIKEIKAKHAGLVSRILEKRELDADGEKELVGAIEAFKKDWS